MPFIPIKCVINPGHGSTLNTVLILKKINEDPFEKIRGVNGERDEELFDVLSKNKKSRKRLQEIEKFRKIRRGQGNLRDVSEYKQIVAWESNFYFRK